MTSIIHGGLFFISLRLRFLLDRSKLLLDRQSENFASNAEPST